MAQKKDAGKPWDFLDEYRGKMFEGQWPNLVQMFEISVKRYPDNRCFVSFTPEKQILTYTEVKKQVITLADYLVSKEIGRAHV